MVLEVLRQETAPCPARCERLPGEPHDSMQARRHTRNHAGIPAGEGEADSVYVGERETGACTLVSTRSSTPAHSPGSRSNHTRPTPTCASPATHHNTKHYSAHPSQHQALISQALISPTQFPLHAQILKQTRTTDARTYTCTLKRFTPVLPVHT